ncbi:hypothetical protein EON83_05190 [bacterium]|nr:MAG: hypothetical protein EON83_05190 [bacterium]
MSRLALYLQNLQRFGIQPGLERIVALLVSAGNPHLQYPHILVGGTNGKGSTCEYTARMLAQNGRRIGLFTSPHLYEWNERIRVLPGVGLFEGTISDEELDALFDDALPHIERVASELGQPTEFEVLTFLGLWHFARVGVAAAVVEVGLGGKWDATNASDPLVSVVTHVALDHMDRLGNTLEEIAADKVCISRPGRLFITGEWKPEVLEVFEGYCNEIGAFFKQIPLSNQNYERQNRALAIVVANEFASQLDWSLSMPNSIMDGVPGRTEKIGDSPAIYIDAANNPDGAQKLVEFFNERIPTQPENVVLVLGILKDKNWREMAETLVPLARTVICCQSDSPRALSAEELADFLRNIHSDVEVIADVKLAVERARELAAHNDTILVTGSFTIIAEVPRNANYSP